ncbi:hypothetical protein SAMN05216525_13949 [Bradyrhizobium sp. Gha]|nr:hypothetical protein SAMN05216525_13949 [Bradyrhizobium sp. Gha]
MIQIRRTYLASRLSLYYRAIAAGIAMTAAMLAPVNAYDRPPTSEEKDACMEDVFRLCSSLIPNRTAITACLRSKQDSLSRKCRYVISRRDSSEKSSGSK